MSTKPTTNAGRKPSAKRKPSNGARWKSGLMSKRETVPLAIAAREAFAHQDKLGNLDAGVTFDDWRHEQVHSLTGNAGLTECHHDNFRPLMARFQTLAGKDAEAFQNQLTTGPATDNPAPGDTHEARRQIAHLIMVEIEAHTRLADISAADLAAETEDTTEYQKLRARRDAILAHEKGAIREGYLIYIVRSKTRRPNLSLGTDLRAGLADRCTAEQLQQILSTIINRIAEREDRPRTIDGRNKSQKSPAARRRRSPGTLSPRGTCTPPAPTLQDSPDRA